MDATNIVICQGSSCFSRGNKENLTTIQKFLKEHDLQAEVTFKGQLCSESCNHSPIITINDKVYTEVNGERILNVLMNHFNMK